MNGSYWSLCLELRWYILFRLFLLLARRFNPWYLVAASLAACAAIPQGVPLHGPLKVPVYLPLLFAGVAVAQTFAQQERLEYRSLVRYAGLGFCFCLGLICLILPGPFDPGRGTFAEVLPTTAFFSFLVLMGLQWQKLNFLGRCLESIGICSYSLYLVHQPLIELLRFALHTDSWTSPWALGYSLLILPLVAIACGYLFFKMFEQPFLDLGKSNPAKTAAVPQLPEGKY
jgi:peptidoglycan/LPS O-acetylase OafA/YrhL